MMATEDLNGRVITRGENGRFTTAQLDPATASKMGALSHGKHWQEAANRLLIDRGINPSDADEGLKTLAVIAVSGKSGAVQALRYLDLLMGYGQPDIPGRLFEGDTCPTCGQRVGGLLGALSSEALQAIVTGILPILRQNEDDDIDAGM